MLEQRQDQTPRKTTTPVKVRVRRIETKNRSPKDTKSPRSPKSPGQIKSSKRKRGLGGQGRQPYPLHSPKQDKISKFFTKKSPKAATARSRGEMNNKDKDMRGEEQKPSTKIIQGAQSPLLGDKGGSQSHPSDDTGVQEP